MKTKLILILAAVVVVAIIGYVAGYQRGRKRQESEMKFRVSFGLHLYQTLEAGDTNRALGDVRFVLWSDTLGFERAFGAPTGTSSFARRFTEAKTITARVEPELRKNAPIFERDFKALLATNNITFEKK